MAPHTDRKVCESHQPAAASFRRLRAHLSAGSTCSKLGKSVFAPMTGVMSGCTISPMAPGAAGGGIESSVFVRKPPFFLTRDAFLRDAPALLRETFPFSKPHFNFKMLWRKDHDGAAMDCATRCQGFLDGRW